MRLTKYLLGVSCSLVLACTVTNPKFDELTGAEGEAGSTSADNTSDATDVGESGDAEGDVGTGDGDGDGDDTIGSSDTGDGDEVDTGEGGDGDLIDCPAEARCVPMVEDAWGPYAAFAVGDQDGVPGCSDASNYPTPGVNLYAGPSFSTECSACACAPVDAPGCEIGETVVELWSDALECDVGAGTSKFFETVVDYGCSGPYELSLGGTLPLPPYFHYVEGPPADFEWACASEIASDAPSFSSFGQECIISPDAVLGACEVDGELGACVIPPPDDPNTFDNDFNGQICVSAPDVLECPLGFELLGYEYTGFEDTRACTDCSCTTGEPGECVVDVTLYESDTQNPGCGVNIGAASSDEQCFEVNFSGGDASFGEGLFLEAELIDVDATDAACLATIGGEFDVGTGVNLTDKITICCFAG